MTDQPNPTMSQTPNDPQNSYVDTYAPPQAVPPEVPAAPVADVPPTAPVSEPPVLTPDLDQPVAEPVSTPDLDQPAAAPAPMTPPAPVQPPTQPSSISQALEDQNVFHLLGVEDAPDAEKESFLDELQQVIWEDFIENDVQLLVTEEEMVDLKKIMDKTEVDDLQKQEEIVVYLEKLIPDLEEIMLEKALELKADMMKERLAGMKEHYAQEPEKISTIEQAEAFVAEDKWREAAVLLNTIA